MTTDYSVTADFYLHWGLSKADVYGKTSDAKNVKLIIDGIIYSGTLVKE